MWLVLPTNEQSQKEQLLVAWLPYVKLPTPSVGRVRVCFCTEWPRQRRGERGRRKEESRETGPTYHDTSSSILYVTRKGCLNSLDMQRQPPFCRWLSRNMHVVCSARLSPAHAHILRCIICTLYTRSTGSGELSKRQGPPSIGLLQPSLVQCATRKIPQN